MSTLLYMKRVGMFPMARGHRTAAGNQQATENTASQLSNSLRGYEFVAGTSTYECVPILPIRLSLRPFHRKYAQLLLSSLGEPGYGLDDRGSRVRFPTGTGNLSLHHRVQNGYEAHPASYPMGTRGSFPGGKAAGA
jgi:hypothetical protein